MTAELSTAGVYTDIAGLAQLRRDAGANRPEATRAVARQFEALFLQMVLKSMRQASFGDPLFDSDQSRLYRDLADRQVALTLAEKGRGTGLADLLVRQLGGTTARSPAPATVAPNPVSRVTPANAAAAANAAQAATTVTRPGRVFAPAPAVQDPVFEPVLDGSVENFVQVLWPQAQDAARELGVDPRFLIAQAALETGWGKSVISHPDGRSSHNLFGIKAHGGWAGERVSVGSLEYVDGVMERQRSAFRSYDSFADSFTDYVSFLKSNSRYRAALQQTGDAAGFARALQDAGYATDPAYASKIRRIMDGPGLNDALAEVKTGPDRSIS